MADDDCGYMDMSGVGNLPSKVEVAHEDSPSRPSRDKPRHVYANIVGDQPEMTENTTQLKQHFYDKTNEEAVKTQDNLEIHSYNVTVIQTESSIRNNLDTAENACWLILDPNDFTICLVQQTAHLHDVGPERYIDQIWPLPAIRRYVKLSST